MLVMLPTMTIQGKVNGTTFTTIPTSVLTLYYHHSSASGKEIKDIKLIFNQAWKNIEDHYGRENLHLPREFIFLMGAPGYAWWN
jgi:hypothetical protein